MYPELKNVTCIVSDFDDTFMRGSEGIKRDVWKQLFSDPVLYERYTVAQDEVSKGNKGGRRYIIVYTLELSETDPRVSDYERKFDQLVQEAIITQGIHSDDLETLRHLKEKGYAVYLLSGTPQDALLETIEKLSQRHNIPIAHLFNLILGQPKNKIENFAIIHEHANVPYAQMVKIGDGESDLKAARTVGAHFIAVTTVRNQLLWAQETFPKIDSFAKLLDIF